MTESLRARLLLWHTLVFSLLIVLYAGTVAYLYWQSLIRDLDAGLATTAVTISRALSPDPAAPGTVDLIFPPQFVETEFRNSTSGAYYAVWSGSGHLIDRSDPAVDFPQMPSPGVFTTDGRRELVVDAPGPARVLVGRRLDGVYADLRSLGLKVAGTGGAVLLLSLAAGSFLAGRALAPVARINKTAGAMIGGDLQARIPVKDTDSELEQVARALNEAFDRMQMAADLQRQFTADASHEFRTPLATLRAEFDWALKRPRSEEEYRGSIEKGQQAVQRLTQIADRLLTLLRPTAHASTREQVDLGALLHEVVALLTPLAQAHDVRIHANVHHVAVTGDRGLLVDAFSNLIKNGVEYNHPSGDVFVTVTGEDTRALVSIRDTGVGIAAEDLPHIFERFYRAERSRSRQVGGAGLGLAIVKQAIEAHGGSVRCSSRPGVGTEFLVTLPATNAKKAQETSVS